MLQDGKEVTPAQLVLTNSLESANIIVLIDESLLLLSQKRVTLEEKAIAAYFHKLVQSYAGIITELHVSMSSTQKTENTTIEVLARLRTVNENVRSCVQELLKILNYDLNYLEQYFEYDYCAKLINNQDHFLCLEAIKAELKN